MKHFNFCQKQDVLKRTRIRRFETKLGEKIGVFEDPLDPIGCMERSAARYVLFGVPESIGVQANHGMGGTETAWSPFLDSFLNIQSLDRFTGEEVMLAGAFDFSPVMEVIDRHSNAHAEKLDACRHAVANIIDDEVEALVRMIVMAGKMPLLIGGGHNNSYPMIKGVAKALHKCGKTDKAKVSAINLDAHADFRIMEGRHSGNGFRYAMEEGFLGRYAVIGLHEHYNPQSMVDDLYSHVDIQYSFMEDIFLHGKRSFTDAVADAFRFVDDQYVMVDLDMDAIEDLPSSAVTPSGISAMHARQYVNFAGSDPKVAGLHICEGAVRLDSGQEGAQTGKLIAYLVSDFIKANL